MSRTERFVKNSLSMAAFQIINMLSGFIVPRIMLETYGSEVNGLISSLTQFILCFNLLEAGIAASASYALYSPLARRSYREINAVLSAARDFYMKSGYFFVVLTMILIGIYPFFIESTVLSAGEVAALAGILSISGALEFFTLAKYKVLLTADQRIHVISLASAMAVVVNVSIVIALATVGADVVTLRGIALGSVFFRSFILCRYVRRHYLYLDYSVPPDKKALCRQWDALYLQVLGVVQTGAPLLLATIFTDLKMVSVYAVFQLIASGMNAVLGIFVSGLSASFGDVIARREQKVLRKAYDEFELAYYMLLVIVYAAAFVEIMPFIHLYTAGISDVNYDLPGLGFLIVLNGLLHNLKTPQGMLVISAGLYRETRLQTSLQAVIIVAGGALLGQTMGLYGIVWASILSNVYRDIDLGIFIPQRVLKISPRKTFFRVIGIGISLLVICISSRQVAIAIDDYADWLLLVIGCSAYAFLWIIGVVFFGDRVVFQSLCQRILQLMRPAGRKNQDE